VDHVVISMQDLPQISIALRESTLKVKQALAPKPRLWTAFETLIREAAAPLSVLALTINGTQSGQLQLQ
jgi:hypothetical protein